MGLVHGQLEVKILDSGAEVETDSVGEVRCAGDNVTKGYLDNAYANESSFTSEGILPNWRSRQDGS